MTDEKAKLEKDLEDTQRVLSIYGRNIKAGIDVEKFTVLRAIIEDRENRLLKQIIWGDK